MSFSRKIFISVFLATFLVGSALVLTAHFYVGDQLRSRFVSRYHVFTDILGATLTRLDQQTESLMLNAAKVVAAKDDQEGLLATEALTELRNDLSITHIFVVAEDGKFIRSTNEDPALIPNLFSFCDEYRNFLGGNTALRATPVIRPSPEPKPYKFLMVPNKKRNRIIEVGVRVDFIAKTLIEAISADKSVKALSLFAPDGSAFGRFAAEGITFTEKNIDIPIDLSEIRETKDNFKFYSQVRSSHPKCCQCDKAGSSRNGEYYYVIEAQVSKDELSAVQATTRNAFIILGLGNLILAFVLSRLLSRRLVRNVEIAASKVRQIQESGDLSSRVDMKGNDEVAYLTQEFDQLLKTLDESQRKIVEAQKVEAKVQMAREVAHNIRSPIIAIEMILPTLISVPERVKKILKNSVREIKSLSDKLSVKNADFALAMTGQRAEIDTVFLPAVIDDIVSQKKIEFADKNQVKFVFQNRGDVSRQFVKLEPLEFKGILSNLINNSVEAFGSTGGHVTITCADSDQYCVVEVIDDGSGIPKEYIDRLGREAITFKGESGRGTALLAAFRMIKDWGGEISIASENGFGAKVVIRLQRYLGEGNEKGPKGSSRNDVGSMPT